INQPLLAFQSRPHEGALGKQLSFLRLSSSQVAVSALKKAEDDDAIVVRLFELHGREAPDVRLSMAAPILSARELTGAEEPLQGPAAAAEDRSAGPEGDRSYGATRDRPARRAGKDLFLEDGALRLSMKPYRPRTIALKLAPLAYSRDRSRTGSR